MRKLALLVLSMCALCWASTAFAQDDSPSLGDVARKSRLEKQQKEAQAAKESRTPASTGEGAQPKDPAGNPETPKPTKRIITNDEIPEHAAPTGSVTAAQPYISYPQKSNEQRAAEQIKSQILQAKKYIASLQAQIETLEHSVHYAAGNYEYGYAQRNERQQQKQGQAETMKQQLAQYQKNLEHMQELARRQGYGSAVYDP